MTPAREQDPYTDICLRRVCDTLGIDPPAPAPKVEIDIDLDAELAPPWAPPRESMVVPAYPVMPTEAKTLPPGPRRRRSHLALVICGALAASAAAFAVGYNPHVRLPLPLVVLR